MPSKYKTPDAIARRRQQSRNNQRRYRQETRSYLQSLQSDRRFANDVARVGAYWRLFMRGYVASPDQDSVLRDLMADDVELREATGIDALFEQWRQYASAFTFFRKELRSIEAVALDSDEHLVCVVGTVSLGLSDAAVATMWPHLRSSSHPDSRIRRRLVDQTLTCPCTQLLYMRPSGDASAKVRRIEFEWDVAAGLATLLKDLDDVRDRPPRPPPVRAGRSTKLVVSSRYDKVFP
ncbi:hypothetical protein SPRG_14552 [Saprolegnia parasitica CBS 223.65]|uniref:BZIP domain-containing protein n=1 Tax=Saprolegnia parasitica (strain CBS 223.65) TaxID=695850 RepID=A0A067BYM4_SAPPC|nr:hypothetical protein SPRG_14552 [Saprolegnia parasitica CBS 223.65]KDO19652.1 hypothetical protein SPRG_14552 [Saprolegnia parasitica CBS 223.65]|eukprot:XP_012209652.1 hypothetical protein SPRG_14552 [Saprolegnia parasitica CBS 223.65]